MVLAFGLVPFRGAGHTAPATAGNADDRRTLEQRLVLQLQILNPFGNKLGSLSPDHSNLVQLEIPDLGENQLMEFSDDFFRLAAPQALKLSKNRIFALPNGFSQLSQLREFDLTGNRLTALPDDFSQSTQPSQLQTIRLGRNSLPVDRLAAAESGVGALFADFA
ncbi:MAG: leucine-rich repeat domain-containing protein [Verrucomicrobiae bacterium]|nr:leucine-rich repeat domain-containing protein [Verrucomicrobiae bacterium]MCP5538751.1 leucine-rich repeat domain-containing protein [Akkermansiaceae bacterium]MCP5549507.1 leucine-rich repeat domain-containing protein [Akkermansiaceae bacterium]